MKQNLSVVRKLKLDHYEIRVLVDALNAKRLKQKESGIDTAETSNLILYFRAHFPLVEYRQLLHRHTKLLYGNPVLPPPLR